MGGARTMGGPKTAVRQQQGRRYGSSASGRRPRRTLSASGGGGCASSARPTVAPPTRPSSAANARRQLPPACCCVAGAGSAAAATALPPAVCRAAAAAAGASSQAWAPAGRRRSSCARPRRSIEPGLGLWGAGSARAPIAAQTAADKPMGRSASWAGGEGTMRGHSLPGLARHWQRFVLAFETANTACAASPSSQAKALDECRPPRSRTAPPPSWRRCCCKTRPAGCAVAGGGAHPVPRSKTGLRLPPPGPYTLHTVTTRPRPRAAGPRRGGGAAGLRRRSFHRRRAAAAAARAHRRSPCNIWRPAARRRARSGRPGGTAGTRGTAGG